MSVHLATMSIPHFECEVCFILFGYRSSTGLQHTGIGGLVIWMHSAGKVKAWLVSSNVGSLEATKVEFFFMG